MMDQAHSGTDTRLLPSVGLPLYFLGAFGICWLCEGLVVLDDRERRGSCLIQE
jgi:hypothetical protein